MSWSDAIKLSLPVVVAVIGWVASHLLTLRAQRKGFQNQIIDKARLDVTGRIRDYQHWLLEFSGTIRSLTFMRTSLSFGANIDLAAKAQEIIALQSRKSEARGWSLALEDYQILFPEADCARRRLDRRHLQIVWGFEPAFTELLKLSLRHPSPTEFDALLALAAKVQPLIDDQISLLEDLRVHLQNSTLSDLVSRSVPTRRPPDPLIPRLALLDGQLEVVDGGGRPTDSDELTLPTRE